MHYAIMPTLQIKIILQYINLCKINNIKIIILNSIQYNKMIVNAKNKIKKH